jgi:hypothetical protein
MLQGFSVALPGQLGLASGSNSLSVLPTMSSAAWPCRSAKAGLQVM